jgi:hypothetical protein
MKQQLCVFLIAWISSKRQFCLFSQGSQHLYSGAKRKLAVINFFPSFPRNEKLLCFIKSVLGALPVCKKKVTASGANHSLPFFNSEQ